MRQAIGKGTSSARASGERKLEGHFSVTFLFPVMMFSEKTEITANTFIFAYNAQAQAKCAIKSSE